MPNLTQQEFRVPLAACQPVLAIAAVLLIAITTGLCPCSTTFAAQSAPKRPRILLHLAPQIVAYQLGRLSNSQLVLVERANANTKYTPVYEALLSREGLDETFRHEAIVALARLNQTDPITEIVAGIDRMTTGSQKRMPHDLGQMLLAQSPEDLAEKIDILARLAKESGSPMARSVAIGAMIRAGADDVAWTHATERKERMVDLLHAMEVIGEPKRRDVLYSRVRQLLDDDTPFQPRSAVIDVLPLFTLGQADSFQTLSRYVHDGVEPDASIRAIGRISTVHWASDSLVPLADLIVDRALKTPLAERTDTPFLDMVELGNKLARKIGGDRGQTIRTTLDSLGVRTIVIRTRPHRMLYDKRQIVVEAGRPIEIVLVNTDIMPHNMVISVPGSRTSLGPIAERMLPQADSQGRHYVPESPKIIGATKMLAPGERQRLSFTVPTTTGNYDFFCTYPGHWMRMFGQMVVVEDYEAHMRSAPSSSGDVGWHEWKLGDFTGPLTINAERVAAGKNVFAKASCSQCHRHKGEGGNFGPDLTDVFKRWEGNEKHVLDQILAPSKKIEDKYRSSLFLLDDGTTLSGIVMAEDADTITIQSGPDASLSRPVDKETILERKPQKASVMPIGLLDPFTREQILDLLAYLKSGSGR